MLEIIKVKTTVSETSRAYDLMLSEVESWVEEGKRGMESALRSKPEDVREQYERHCMICKRHMAKQCWITCSMKVSRPASAEVPRRTVYYQPMKAVR